MTSIIPKHDPPQKHKHIECFIPQDTLVVTSCGDKCIQHLKTQEKIATESLGCCCCFGISLTTDTTIWKCVKNISSASFDSQSPTFQLLDFGKGRVCCIDSQTTLICFHQDQLLSVEQKPLIEITDQHYVAFPTIRRLCKFFLNDDDWWEINGLCFLRVLKCCPFNETISTGKWYSVCICDEEYT